MIIDEPTEFSFNGNVQQVERISISEFERPASKKSTPP